MHWIVLSDSHGNSKAILDIFDAEPEAAGFIHLGDLAADMHPLTCLTPLPVVQVAGNCDPLSDIPREVELSLGGTRLFLTHGHLYGVKGGLLRLAQRARHCRCSVVLYGHTHRAACESVDRVLLVNPGTLQTGAPSHSYARLRIEGGCVQAELVSL